MYRIRIDNFRKPALAKELIDEFLRPDQYLLTDGRADLVIDEGAGCSADEVKRALFDELRLICGTAPDWGILTGVRPVKLYEKLLRERGSRSAATDALTGDYRLSGDKASLLAEIYAYQSELAGPVPDNSFGMYVGIPFCPTRCLYCSFASNQASEGEIARYLEALKRELRETAVMVKAHGLRPETIYFGGGTPSILSAAQIEELLGLIEDCYDLSGLRELSYEAGRPDTIDSGKLLALKRHGTDRISINPQSHKAETLALIGRSHTSDDIERAFILARDIGFDSINADLICGLPGEDREDFMDSLAWVEELGADNITVHSLAVKRASRLAEQDPGIHYRQAGIVRDMAGSARKKLAADSYRPYYLYRQKHMAGACENIGYCRDNRIGLYNIRIMAEHQSILAFGAGGMSKVYFPQEDRLERVADLTNYREYIARIDEMTERKRKAFFGQEERNAD